MCKYAVHKTVIRLQALHYIYLIWRFERGMSDTICFLFIRTLGIVIGISVKQNDK